MKLIADNLRITKINIQNARKAQNPKPVQDLVKLCLAKERIIIDPIVPPLAWADGIAQARAMLNVIHTLPDLLNDNLMAAAGATAIIAKEDLFFWAMMPGY